MKYGAQVSTAASRVTTGNGDEMGERGKISTNFHQSRDLWHIRD
jgi:hypothetical protein